MKKRIRNYTSTVAPEKTIAEIENRLVEFGCSNIVKDYENKKLIGFYFTINYNGKNIIIKMPARIKEVQDCFLRDIKKPRKSTYKKWEAQSEKTAWKLLYDWVDIQLTNVELKRMDMMEVFLSFVYYPDTEDTLYERVSSGQMKLLPGATK